ncbi:MAG TPA: DUF459 domain-containing protein [Enhygromyxa sp.]|nr:DUF459 domain-containing protein [Enhygromyxa sp.]
MQTRRRFLVSLAALPMIAAPRRARAGAKILMIGDSMIAGGFGLFLAQDLEREHGYAVDRRGKSSTGLARPDFHDWISVGAAARAEAKPTAVVCMFGGNDGQGLYIGRDQWIRYGEPGWTPEYRRRVNAFADGVTANGERLIWIGMPQMRLDRLQDRVGHMNTIYEAEMALRPNARYVRIWDVLAVDGEYSDHVEIAGKRTRVRTGDGVHITTAGAHYLADFVRPFIAGLLG